MYKMIKNIFNPTPQWKLNEDLHAAICQGQLKLVCDLLEQGASINYKEYRNTPLTLSITQGHPDIALELLKRGAEIDYIIGHNYTALMLAVIRNYIPLVDELLTKGADVHKKDIFNNTVLHIAASHGHVEIVRLLLQKTSLDKNELNGKPVPTSIMHSKLTPLMEASREGHLEVVRELLAHGADINFVDREGDSALTWAIHMGKEEVAHELLLKGAAFNTKQIFPPLVVASMDNRVTSTQQLLEKFSALNPPPAHYADASFTSAAAHGHADVIHEFLAKEAVDFDTFDGMRRANNALVTGLKNNHKKVVEQIKNNLEEKFEKQKLGLELFFLGRSLQSPIEPAESNELKAITKLPNDLVKTVESYLDPSFIMEEAKCKAKA